MATKRCLFGNSRPPPSRPDYADAMERTHPDNPVLAPPTQPSKAAFAAATLIWLVAAACLLARFGATLECAQWALLCADLCALSVIDLRFRLIPHLCIGVALALRIAYLAIAVALGTIDGGVVIASFSGLLILGMGSLLTAAAASHLSGRASLGGGDVKLFAVVGFYFGVGPGAAVLFLACLFSLLFAAIAWLLPGKTDGTFPFGPAISLGCLVVMLA